MSEQSDSTATAGAGDGKHFRGWEAILNLQPIVSPKPLRVRGEYFLDKRCGGVDLRMAVPQGFNPAQLILEVVPQGDGDGGWEPASESFEATAGQYESVMVRDDKGNSVTMEVQEVH